MTKPSISDRAAGMFFPSATTNGPRNQKRKCIKGTKGTMGTVGTVGTTGTGGTMGTTGTVQVRWRIPTKLAKDIKLKAIKEGKSLQNIVQEIISKGLK